MKKFFSLIKRELDDYKILLRSVPSMTVTIFTVSVVCANLMANKELISFKYLALDCGFAFSWLMFLCMDVICKRWGAKAAIKVSSLALFVNLTVCISFKLLALTSGMWGEFYATGDIDVNNALNATFGESWYVVFGSSLAFAVSSVANAVLNCAAASFVKTSGFKEFAFRSYTSTIAAQFIDNLVFSAVVSKTLFGWTWTQIFVCSATGAVFELLCEVLFSLAGYKIVCEWEKDNVGKDYFDRIKICASNAKSANMKSAARKNAK